MKLIFFGAWAMLASCPLCSQFETTLPPGTLQAFDSYAKEAENGLAARWSGNGSFISLAESPANAKRLAKGDDVIQPLVSPNPKPIPDGLIHDWAGAVFIPNVTVEQVMGVLQDFDRHSKMYPEIIQSHLIKKNGGDLTGYWRIQRKQQMVPAVFDIEQEAHYKQVGAGKWICRAYSTVREVQDAGSSHEKVNPPGQGLGLLWKLEAFWTLQESKDGVLAECRTISLSRDIPNGLGWMIRPFIQNVPRESLASTLENTRRALAHRP